MKNTIIITAGGIGKRMGTEIPKQFIEINELPILMHTINQFFDYDNSIQIIVVLPKEHIDYWTGLINKFKYKIKHKIVIGGQERFYSIKNGLQIATGQIIGIHDGVRPFVSTQVIQQAFKTAKTSLTAIPVIDLKESIVKLENNSSKSVDRSKYKIVQTPQCFQSHIIKKAYLQSYSSHFTDDASVVEKMGEEIHLIQGNDENIKITTPFDLVLAEAILKSN